jgi:hypothetical protein
MSLAQAAERGPVQDLLKLPLVIATPRALPRRAHHAAAALLAAGLFASSVLGSSSAPAGEVPVSLGSVAVGKAKPEVRMELRALLRAELSSADFARLKPHEQYVLSASLVRLDSALSSDSVLATCVISVALLRDGGSTLYAVIHGRATAEDARARSEAAQSDALRAAVHSAMVRVPQALR